MEVVADAVDGHDLLEKLDLVTADVLLLTSQCPVRGWNSLANSIPTWSRLIFACQGEAAWI